MRLDPLGIPIYNKQDVLDIIYQGQSKSIGEILVDIDQTELDKFNYYAQESGATKLHQYQSLDVSQEDFDQSLQSNWLMPEEYKEMNIAKWILDQCTNQDQLQRCGAELLEFQRRDMMNLLRWMKYFVDTCRTNKIVWGVGRGSSVASYCLYLIGVHKIDSMKYNLDWQEFLR